MITTFSFTFSFQARSEPSAMSQPVTDPPALRYSEPVADQAPSTERYLVWYPPTRFFYIPNPGRWVPHHPQHEVLDHNRYASTKLNLPGPQ